MNSGHSEAMWSEPGRLDRVDAHRSAGDWIKCLWHAEETQLIKITEDGRLATNADGSRLRCTRPFVEYDDQRHILLGMVDEVAYFTVQAVIDGPLHTLREVATRLSAVELELATAATAITTWHRTAPYCPSCAGLTTMINGGFARVCSQCERQQFPRTDPAVIVAIVDPADRLLLARASAWGDTNRVSVLAGFVEAGESFELAVHREIGEEADVSLTDLRYFGSQPWPFPRSIMVGFFARATSTDISIDGIEIVYADWFSRERLTAELESGTLGLPTPASIAYRLVTAWRERTHPYAKD